MNDKLEDNMGEEILIEPMSEKFLLWRCLYSGPLSAQTIDMWPSGSQMDWERFRNRNIPLLAKLTRTYGACAILARADDKIVGQVRFYPRVIWDIKVQRKDC
jgi:hypothetical protein